MTDAVESEGRALLQAGAAADPGGEVSGADRALLQVGAGAYLRGEASVAMRVWAPRSGVMDCRSSESRYE